MSIKKSWNKLSRAIPDNKMVRILIAKQLKDSAYYCIRVTTIVNNLMY